MRFLNLTVLTDSWELFTFVLREIDVLMVFFYQLTCSSGRRLSTVAKAGRLGAQTPQWETELRDGS